MKLVISLSLDASEVPELDKRNDALCYIVKKDGEKGEPLSTHNGVAVVDLDAGAVTIMLPGQYAEYENGLAHDDTMNGDSGGDA